jgi:protocatechuate 3,4-dioxygenase beta subunit
MRYADTDDDLVKIDGRVERAGGEIVRLRGRVLDRQGSPVAGARVEIWQCDVNGRYLHRRDRGGERDPAFQGFGAHLTGADGVYRFRTIKPVPYTGRTPHIHVKVRVDGRERLTTQFYLPDHPGNARDWLYQRIPEAQRDLVTMHFAAGGGEPEASVDLVI